MTVNSFQDNRFDFDTQGELRLHYCGKRERSMAHTYTHDQGNYLLLFVCEGEAMLTAGDTTQPLTRGSVCVMFPESGASYVTAEGVPWTIRWVTLTGSLLTTLLPLLGLTPEHAVVSTRLLSRMEHLHEDLFALALREDFRSKLTGMALLYELFACLPQHTGSEDGRIAESMQYIFRHYAEPLTVGQLAARVYLNSNYFSKLFTAQTGMTPQQLLVRTRMEKAKELLTHTTLSVGEVSALVGYSDPLYFSRVFKRYTGLSPSQFA